MKLKNFSITLTIVLLISTSLIGCNLLKKTTDWNGNWNTNWGKMTIKVNGNKATASYEHNDGTLDGTINGNEFSGKWYEGSTEPGGNFLFTLKGNKFEGGYDHNGTNAPDDSLKQDKNSWTGTKSN